MRAKALCVTLLAVLATACGQGRAIFIVDVYSFMAGTADTSIHYYVPPPPSTALPAYTIRKLSLPGAGSSLVDSVRVNGSVTYRNQNRADTVFVGFQMYLAADSAGTYAAAALALTVPDTTVSDTITVRDTIARNLAPAVIGLLTKSELWVRFQAKGTNGGLTLAEGDAVLKSFVLTVFLNDKFF